MVCTNYDNRDLDAYKLLLRDVRGWSYRPMSFVDERLSCEYDLRTYTALDHGTRCETNTFDHDQ